MLGVGDGVSRCAWVAVAVGGGLVALLIREGEVNVFPKYLLVLSYFLKHLAGVLRLAMDDWISVRAVEGALRSVLSEACASLALFSLLTREAHAAVADLHSLMETISFSQFDSR